MIFDKGVNYIKEYARPLEKQLLEYYFFDGSKYSVLEELLKYHNSDGGFGKGLEPDYRSEKSSILATTYAIDILIDLDFPSTEITVITAIKYILDNFNSEKESWRIIPEIDEDYAHAPWWIQSKIDETFNSCIENPKVKICGYLFNFKDITKEIFRNKILADVLDVMENRDDFATPDVMQCYIRLYESKNLPLDSKHKIKKKLHDMILKSVERDSKKWKDYSLKPIDIIKSNESPFTDLILESFDNNLDYEVERQECNGSWTPNWNWGERFPREWSLAKREWSGIKTLEMLRILKDFNRI